MLVRQVRLLVPAIALVLLAATLARADNEKLAKHLHQLDPGALVGGKSIVGTKPGQELRGVHGKPNFIVALGDEETIHGASRNDELGAIGEGAKIVPSNHGHSLIVGGPRSEIVVTGKGHNLIFSDAKGATIILESPGDEVIATSPHELIEVAKGEKVSKSCRGHHNQVEHMAATLSAAKSSAIAHASAAVIGDGSNGFPFSADCDDPAQVDCKVSSFAPRTLNDLWWNEKVPAYQCPVPGHRFLLNHSYAPAGTSLPRGVEVEGLGPIGVSITSTRYENLSDGSPISIGTPNADGYSSATNWTFGPKSYKVILHCTGDPSHGYSPNV